jgi:hypothetical protein
MGSLIEHEQFMHCCSWDLVMRSLLSAVAIELTSIQFWLTALSSIYPCLVPVKGLKIHEVPAFWVEAR